MRQPPTPRIALAACAMLLVAGCGPVSAALHDPRDLPALERDARVHYDANAKGYAEAVAKLLPGAMARVEAAQGGLSKDAFVVAAYLDEDAYARRQWSWQSEGARRHLFRSRHDGAGAVARGAGLSRSRSRPRIVARTSLGPSLGRRLFSDSRLVRRRARGDGLGRRRRARRVRSRRRSARSSPDA